MTAHDLEPLSVAASREPCYSGPMSDTLIHKMKQGNQENEYGERIAATGRGHKVDSLKPIPDLFD